MSDVFTDLAAELTGPTITVEEALPLFNAAGLKISNDFLMAGLRAGKFSFGFAIEGKTARYWISLPKLVAWLREWSGE